MFQLTFLLPAVLQQAVRARRGLHPHLLGQSVPDRVPAKVVRRAARGGLRQHPGRVHLQLQLVAEGVHQVPRAEHLVPDQGQQEARVFGHSSAAGGVH